MLKIHKRKDKKFDFNKTLRDNGVDFVSFPISSALRHSLSDEVKKNIEHVRVKG